MKKVSLIAGLASLGAVAALLWTLPAAASTGCSVGCTHEAHSGRADHGIRDHGNDADEDDSNTTSVPEPGTLALLGLGLSGLGLTGLSRKRNKK